MKKLITIMALLITISSQAQLFEFSKDNPQRGKFVVLGAIGNELAYQGYYCITKDHKKAVWLSFTTTTLAGLAINKFEACPSMMMMAGAGINSGLHDFAYHRDWNWTVYELKVNFAINRNKKHARQYFKEKKIKFNI